MFQKFDFLKKRKTIIRAYIFIDKEHKRRCEGKSELQPDWKRDIWVKTKKIYRLV